MQKNKKTASIQAKIDENLKLKLQIYCSKHDRSEADVIRMILKKFLKNINTKQLQTNR